MSLLHLAIQLIILGLWHKMQALIQQIDLIGLKQVAF